MEKIRKVTFVLSIILIVFLSACNNKKAEEKQKIDPMLKSGTEEDTLLVQETIDDLEEEVNENFPKLSVIIDDFGNYNNFMLDSLLVKFDQLPTEVAFAILPNLPYSEFVMEYFQNTDRELLLHTPMEPLNDKINAGDLVIESKDDAITIINKLNSMYGQLNKVVGLNNHMGSRATADSEVMTSVLQWCKENNLFFVDSATINNSLAYDLALELEVPTAKRSMFLDVPDASIETVDKYLSKLSKYSEEGKDILVITHASTLQRQTSLYYFLEQASQLGYKLVPLSKFLTYPPKDKSKLINPSNNNPI